MVLFYPLPLPPPPPPVVVVVVVVVVFVVVVVVVVVVAVAVEQFGRDSPPALPDWMEWFMKLHRFYEKWFALNTSKIASANFSSPPKLPNIIWLSAFSYPNGDY